MIWTYCHCSEMFQHLKFEHSNKFLHTIVYAAYFRPYVIFHPHHPTWEISWQIKVGRNRFETYMKSSVRHSQYFCSCVPTNLCGPYEEPELEKNCLTGFFCYLDISSYKCWLGTYRDRTKRRMATSRRLSNHNQYEAPIHTVSKYVYNRCSRDQI